MQARTLRVMSFNLRYTNPADGPNYWTHRKELCFQTIRQFDPDLLGMQEVCTEQYDDLREAFGNYEFTGVAREDGGQKGERALILQRSERLERLAGGDFWLSQTPDVVGSRSWDSKHFRICTWVKSLDRQTGRQLLHANTHFDDEGVIARTESARLLRAKLPQLAGEAAIVLTGDFNSTEDHDPYGALTKPGHGKVILLDSHREIHPQRSGAEGTLHGFKGIVDGPRIDWILHTPQLTATAATIDRRRAPDGRYPSDHFPIETIFQWV